MFNKVFADRCGLLYVSSVFSKPTLSDVEDFNKARNTDEATLYSEFVRAVATQLVAIA